MERPRGVNLNYPSDRHRLCTLHRREGLYGQVRLRGYMRDSRLKSKPGRHQPHRRNCTAEGPSSILTQWSGLSVTTVVHILNLPCNVSKKIGKSPCHYQAVLVDLPVLVDLHVLADLHENVDLHVLFDLQYLSWLTYEYMILSTYNSLLNNLSLLTYINMLTFMSLFTNLSLLTFLALYTYMSMLTFMSLLNCMFLLTYMSRLTTFPS